MGIRENADTLVALMAGYAESPNDPKRGAYSFMAQRLRELSGMEPSELNNAVELLEQEDHVKVWRAQGGGPYRFMQVQLKARGRLHAEQLTSAEAPNVKPTERDPGRFIDFEELGEGNEGEVWQATDTKLKRCVAIKFVHETGLLGRSVLSHARALTQLQHPHVVTAHDVLPIAHPKTGEVVEAVVMEKVDGIGLDEQLGKPVSVHEARRIVRALVDVASAYHAKGLAHMDLYDHNVLVAPSGLKVLDPIYRDSGVLASTSSLARRQQRDTANVRDIIIQLLHVTDVAPEARARFVEATIKASLSELGIAFETALTSPPLPKPVSHGAAISATRREVLEKTYERLRRLHGATRDLISLVQYDPPTPAEREAREAERSHRFEEAWSSLQQYNLSNALYLGKPIEEFVGLYMQLIMKCHAGWRAGRGVNSDASNWVHATQALDGRADELLKAITAEMQRLLGVV